MGILSNMSSTLDYMSDLPFCTNNQNADTRIPRCVNTNNNKLMATIGTYPVYNTLAQ